MKRSVGGTRSLWAALALLTLLAAVGVAAFLVRGEAAIRVALLEEIGKALVGIVAVGVIGGVVQLLLDGHAREHARRQRLAEFRADKVRRVVQVTNTLRRAPILIDANRSARTYGEQMRAIVDAGLELRLIRHEIAAIGPMDNPAFSSWPTIEKHFRAMESYVAAIEREFRANNKELGELQVGAEQDRARQREVWGKILQLEMVKDLLGEVSPGAGGTRWAAEYQKPYEQVLQLMVRSSVEPGAAA